MSTTELLVKIQRFLDSLGTGKPLIVSQAKKLSDLITNDEADEIIDSLTTKGNINLAQDIMYIRTRANALLKGNINEHE